MVHARPYRCRSATPSAVRANTKEREPGLKLRHPVDVHPRMGDRALVPGNPKGSAWSSTPRAKRHRKELSVTLSDEEREALEAIAKRAGGAPLSRVVAAAIAVLAKESPGSQQKAVNEAALALQKVKGRK